MPTDIAPERREIGRDRVFDALVRPAVERVRQGRARGWLGELTVVESLVVAVALVLAVARVVERGFGRVRG